MVRKAVCRKWRAENGTASWVCQEIGAGEATEVDRSYTVHGKPKGMVDAKPRFARASQDRFFLCIEALDPKFDRIATEQFLLSLGPSGEIMEVPH